MNVKAILQTDRLYDKQIVVKNKMNYVCERWIRGHLNIIYVMLQVTIKLIRQENLIVSIKKNKKT